VDVAGRFSRSPQFDASSFLRLQPTASPTTVEALNIMDAIEIALSEMVRRWHGDISAEVRDAGTPERRARARRALRGFAATSGLIRGSP
jgi:hypothetical protein